MQFFSLFALFISAWDTIIALQIQLQSNRRANALGVHFNKVGGRSLVLLGGSNVESECPTLEEVVITGDIGEASESIWAAGW